MVPCVEIVDSGSGSSRANGTRRGPRYSDEGVSRQHDSSRDVVGQSEAGFVAAAGRNSIDRKAAVERGPVEKRLLIEAARRREKERPFPATVGRPDLRRAGE